MNNDEKIVWLRHWLRYHGEYHITIDLWGMYGTVELKFYHYNDVLKWFRGMNISKRLDEVIRYIQEDIK